MERSTQSSSGVQTKVSARENIGNTESFPTQSTINEPSNSRSSPVLPGNTLPEEHNQEIFQQTSLSNSDIENAGLQSGERIPGPSVIETPASVRVSLSDDGTMSINLTPPDDDARNAEFVTSEQNERTGGLMSNPDLSADSVDDSSDLTERTTVTQEDESPMLAESSYLSGSLAVAFPGRLNASSSAAIADEQLDRASANGTAFLRAQPRLVSPAVSTVTAREQSVTARVSNTPSVSGQRSYGSSSVSTQRSYGSNSVSIRSEGTRQGNRNVQDSSPSSFPEEHPLLPDAQQPFRSEMWTVNFGSTESESRTPENQFTISRSNREGRLPEDPDIFVEGSTNNIPVFSFLSYPHSGDSYSSSVSSLYRSESTAVATATARTSHHVHTAVVITRPNNDESQVALRTAINRAIAGAFAGSGEGAVASNIINTTHRLQLWDMDAAEPPDLRNRK